MIAYFLESISIHFHSFLVMQAESVYSILI